MVSIGVDTGGTFTDVVLHRPGTGGISTFKVPSTPDDPGAAVEHGLERLAREHGVRGPDIERFIFGTTVATNAVLEQRGAPTALVATRGTRDVLEIQRQWRRRLFDLELVKPAPLAARRHRIEAAERVDAQGEVLTPLTEAEIDRLVAELGRMPVEAVAVSLLFSFLRPEHERAIAEAVRARLPGLHVTVSSEICPEFREYERTATTAMNAYTMPKIRALAERLEAALGRAGFRGVFSIVQSNGGVMTLEKARTHPVNTLLSGPAAGVVAAARIGRLSGAERVLAFDVGGTSTDIALVERGEVQLSAEGGIGGHPVKVPQVRIHTIGAGGGSIARPELGLLKVGPASAGARPGPVGYGLGGTEPTGTDAALALGLIDPGGLLGGEMRLDRAAARNAIAERVAGPLGLEPDRAAHAILQVQVANIVAGIRKVSVEAGEDPRDFALMPFGGAGGVYAGAVAEELGIARILLPPHGGVLSALGMLMTDIRHDKVLTRLAPLDALDPAEAEAVFDSLVAEADAELSRDRVAPGRVEHEFACDMRYSGQAYEIKVTLPGSGARPRFDAAALRAAFDAAHERLYGQASPGEPVEVVNYRVGAIGRVDAIALPERAPGPATPPPPRGHRPVYLSPERGWHDCPVWARDDLAPGAAIAGPAAIEDSGASLFLHERHAARVDRHGIIAVETGAAAREGGA
jgi:N-methylhydantoinase A